MYGQLERRPENTMPAASTVDGGIKILTIKLSNILKTGTSTDNIQQDFRNRSVFKCFSKTENDDIKCKKRHFTPFPAWTCCFRAQQRPSHTQSSCHCIVLSDPDVSKYTHTCTTETATCMQCILYNDQTSVSINKDRLQQV